MPFPTINPTRTQAWKKLESHAAEMKQIHMRELFRNDPSRFDAFSQTEGNLLFDYSKNIITDETLKLLNELAQTFRKRRFDNGAINFSSTEVRFKLDETGKPIGIVVKERHKNSAACIQIFTL